MSDPPRLPESAVSRKRRGRLRLQSMIDRHVAAIDPVRSGKETPVPREDRRESALVRVAADCCTCVAVEGGQMHEDADQTGVRLRR